MPPSSDLDPSSVDPTRPSDAAVVDRRVLRQPLPPLLVPIEAEARASGLGFAGHVAPKDAWVLFEAGQALLVDVRSRAERQFVGRVPGAAAAAWAEGLALERNPDFAEELERALASAGVGPRESVPLLLLCRSGVRSIRAAEAATAAGHPAVFNVLEGFEGALDPRRQRGHLDGWRRLGLPWEQG